MPEKIKEWFTYDEEVFQCLRGSAHSSKLGPLLKERGTTIANFYQAVVKAAYSRRLGGEEHLDSYHLERDLGEVEAVPKPGEVQENQLRKVDGSKQRIETEVEGRREEEEEADLENRKEEEERHNEAVRQLLKPGEIMMMHKDAKSGPTPVLQLITKKVVDGKLISMTMSDGSHVSENFSPSNEHLAREFTDINRYDLIKIQSASIQKSEIILHAIDHLQLKDNKGGVVEIKGPVKARGVLNLKQIRQEALDTWGVRYATRRKIDARPAQQDHNSTLMEQDPFMMEGGKRQSTFDEPSGSKRAKRAVEQCAFCIRTFVDKTSLKVHMQDELFD